MTDEVLVSRRGHIQVISINRPHRRNALNATVAHAIMAAIDELESDSELSVGVLTGADGVFSSGMDLKAFTLGETPMCAGRGLCGITNTRASKPLIAAVEGWALAGGFELVLACDMVVAGRSSRFGLPETTIGLVPGAGGAYRLPTKIPQAIALEMLLTGEPIEAGRACGLGLVNRIVDDGSALEAAITLAETIARNPIAALVASKKLALVGEHQATPAFWEWQLGVTLAAADFDEKSVPRRRPDTSQR